MTLNTPAGHSNKERLHLVQGRCNSKWDFTKYSYGFSKNLKIYGLSSPPSYNLSHILQPTLVVYGLRDTIAVPRDVQNLIAILPNVWKVHQLKDYNHLDVVIGKNVNNKVNRHVISFLK